MRKEGKDMIHFKATRGICSWRTLRVWGGCDKLLERDLKNSPLLVSTNSKETNITVQSQKTGGFPSFSKLLNITWRSCSCKTSAAPLCNIHQHMKHVVENPARLHWPLFSGLLHVCLSFPLSLSLQEWQACCRGSHSPAARGHTHLHVITHVRLLSRASLRLFCVLWMLNVPLLTVVWSCYPNMHFEFLTQ